MVATALAVGGGIASSIIGGNAAKSAAEDQADAIRRAVRLQKKMYEQGREDMAPWLAAGKQSLATLQGELGNSYEASKGYNWQVQEGEKGVLSNLSALGMTNSGSALKALEQFRQGLANQDYGQWYNRQAQLASGGQQQSGALAQQGQNYANTAGNLMGQLGAVQASGTVGQANAYREGIGDFMGYLGNRSMQPGGLGFGGGGGQPMSLGYRPSPMSYTPAQINSMGSVALSGTGGLY